ncbi:MAG: hypothetical protein MSC30_10380 [Gaiellaceae bacterium MAG52_C11]|nr:hypothetical protein [Candidatus Gaiellasilicea maunaloa]
MSTRRHSGSLLTKQVLAARIRADLAEKRIKRKDLARWTERSAKTVERWTSDGSENESYRPTRSESIVLAYLTGYPVSRYTGDESDDILFPLSGAVRTLSERLRAAEELAGAGSDAQEG